MSGYRFTQTRTNAVLADTESRRTTKTSKGVEQNEK